MTLFQGSLGNPSENGSAARIRDGLRVLATLGDLACGEPSGFSHRVAALAHAFAEYAGVEPANLDAVYYGALLHATGAILIRIDPTGGDVSERRRVIAGWDAAANGAAIVRRLGGLVDGTEDIVRWHREEWDGSGFPDNLRWNGIPLDASVVGLARTFVKTIAQTSPEEALLELLQSAGRAFSSRLLGRFREFAILKRDLLDSGSEPDRVPDVNIDPLALAADLVDERTPDATGRARSVHATAMAIARVLELTDSDRDVLRTVALLAHAGEVRTDAVRDRAFDPLSRIGREGRADDALAASRLLIDAPVYEPAAPALRGLGEWYDGSGHPDRLRGTAIPLAARIVAVAVADQVLEAERVAGHDPAPPLDRIAAAAGTQFDPVVIDAYVRVRAEERS